MRPPFSYYGGKARIADWVISHFPPHEVFVDLFGGAANIVLNKPPVRLDVYNDLDSQIVNFFRVLRERTEEFIQAVELTPYSREEFDRARKDGDNPDDFERARRFFVLMKMSSYPGRVERCSWRWKNTTRQRGNEFIDAWRNTDYLASIAGRFKCIQIENSDYRKALERYDGAGTLFYADPPYLHTTRYKKGNARGYTEELDSPEAHREIAQRLGEVQGMTLVSGYQSPLYDEIYAGWQRAETTTRDSNQNERVECLWISPNASVRLEQAEQEEASDLGPLFAGIGEGEWR